MKRLAIPALVLLATPAFAHQGDHAHFDLAGLIAHIFEPDHVIFAAIAVLTGIFAYRAGKKAGKKSGTQGER